METLKKKTTKKEQQELLLRETKKTSQKELAHLKKRRKILTSEELIKMKETSQMWDERFNMRKNLTPLEELQFICWSDKRDLLSSIVERMIIYRKPGPYDQSIKELECFDINVPGLLWQNQKLKEEKEEKDNEITGLRAIINANDSLIEGKEYIIKTQKDIIKLKEERISHYKDCNIDQTETMNRYANALGLDSREEGPLRVV